jgi:hypothetical protein
MFKFIQKLIKLRKENKELRLIDNEWIKTCKKTGTVIIKKEDVTILINNSEEKLNIALPKFLQNKKVIDLFEEKEIKLSKEVMLNAYGYLLFKA